MGKIRIRSRYRGRIPQTIAESASGVDTPTIQVTGTGGEEHPNEPAGFVPICEHDYTVRPGLSGGGVASNGLLGQWWQATSAETNMTIGTDGASGQSPPNYLAVRYPANLNVGVAPTHWQGWNPFSPAGAFPQSEVYVSTWIRIRGNGTNYENQSTGTKLFYVSYMNTVQQNQSFLMLRSSPGVALHTLGLRTAFPLSYYIRQVNATTGADPLGGALEHGQNIQSKHLLIGQWHQVELYLKANTISQPPTADGVFKLWIDGVLTSHYTTVRFLSESNPKGFYKYVGDPVFGGSDNAPNKSRDDYIDWDHTYVSGIPQVL